MRAGRPACGGDPVRAAASTQLLCVASNAALLGTSAWDVAQVVYTLNVLAQPETAKPAFWDRLNGMLADRSFLVAHAPTAADYIAYFLAQPLAVSRALPLCVC